MPETPRIVVLEGDQTGQELLEQAVRLLDPGLLEIDLELKRYDLSLENRRATSNRVVSDAAAAMREAGLGLKAATIVRMAVEDAYGAKESREGEPGSPSEVAYRTDRITRSVCRAVAEYAFRTAERMGARVYGGPKWTVSPIYEGMLKEELDAAAARHSEIEYRPVLIDATYAGLLSGATDVPLVIPALNRDGDCLSDLVLPMFGSIAGAESVLLSFDESYDTTVAMAEAPHGTAPALLGKDIANPLAMILACGAVLRHAADRYGPTADRASRAIYEAALETVASGTKTPDLGGHSGTTEFTDSVLERVRTKIEVWGSLGSAA
jgi:3-isopropylmalate dehydrogenase